MDRINAHGNSRCETGLWEDVEADGVEVVSGAAEHADDAAVVEHGQAVVRAVHRVPERAVAGLVGHKLERGDAVLDLLELERSHRPVDLSYVLRGAQRDRVRVFLLPSGAAPGPGGVQLVVLVPVGEGDGVEDLAPADGDALQPLRRHRF